MYSIQQVHHQTISQMTELEPSYQFRRPTCQKSVKNTRGRFNLYGKKKRGGGYIRVPQPRVNHTLQKQGKNIRIR